MTLKAITRSVAIAALLGATALTMPAIAQAQSTITGGFDVGPGGFQGNFNPLAATGGLTWLSVYFEPLVIYNAELTALQGSLASEWTVSEDLREITFTLAEETWHDGEAFTSADVKFTLELAKNAATGSVFSARLNSISSIEAPDDRTVVLKLSAPDSGLLSTLSQVMILPQHALADIAPEAIATSTWWATSPIGTGPFKFTQYVTDQYVELAADEDYRLGRPVTDRVINRYFDNSAAAVSALRAGEIDFTYVESDDAKTFDGSADFRVIEGASFVVNYVGFNHMVDLWDDVRVRQAFMYAIDRDAIIESLYGGAATAANCGYIAPQLVPSDIEPYAYDPEKARALLAEAGWAEINGDKPITWLTYYNTPLAANVMAAAQAMLAQVGINVVPRVVDTPTYNGIVYKEGNPDWNAFPLVYAGLQNGPNPAGINVGLNESQLPPNGANIMRVQSRPLSAAFDAALGETDAAQADARWQNVCRVMNEELPWATMWVANRYGVASNDLVDFVWTPAPAGGPFASHPEKWAKSE
ncbi:peptide ABC transporter substrate-binding protein [Devosia limi DSM 17137]|uniref:Peptide ABC transporter substrate-binding protein n=1 Tax=Devosia limi DSM 17137 TaxID=1121477 RepID=A0A0F5LVV6_9HYPH|nr:ABC transporter substrate-binding protein [Devosia limi]KKB86505.1 peptide ABC transporter substrate-binding protein [Devosia limi DSM 17137]SHE86254.1 peptide/nickel transport system substrate-binding protein [Devosia limi DSM 17137]